MKKINFFLFAILLVIFTSCSLNLKESNNQNSDMVEFSLYFGDSGNSRTLRPGKITAANLHDVKVTFRKGNDTVSATPVAGKAYTYYLPEGKNYDVMVEGIVNNSKVSGRTTFNLDRVLGAYAFIDLKYTYENEYGKVDFTVDTSKVVLAQDENIENVEAYLVKKSGSNAEKSYKLDCRESGSILTLKSATLVPAGIYELDIFYNLNSMPKMVPLKDSLVQVLNGQTTKLDIDAPAFSPITDYMQSYYNEVSSVVQKLDVDQYITTPTVASTKFVTCNNANANTNSYNYKLYSSFPDEYIQTSLGQSYDAYKPRVYFDSTTGNTILNKLDNDKSSLYFYPQNGTPFVITLKNNETEIRVDDLAISNNNLFVRYYDNFYRTKITSNEGKAYNLEPLPTYSYDAQKVIGLAAINNTIFIIELNDDDDELIVRRLLLNGSYDEIARIELPNAGIFNSYNIINIKNTIYVSLGSNTGGALNQAKSTGTIVAIQVTNDNVVSTVIPYISTPPYYQQGVSEPGSYFLGPGKFLGIEVADGATYFYLADEGFYYNNNNEFKVRSRVLKIKSPETITSGMNLQDKIVNIIDNLAYFFEYSSIRFDSTDSQIYFETH